MLARLIFFFVAIPLLEFLILIEVGRMIGLLSTLAIVIFTGILGAWLARRQGLDVLQTIRTELNQNKLPASALLDGAMILLAAVVLMTPGILTDAVGFCLLMPAIRRRIRKTIQARLENWIRRGSVQVTYSSRPDFDMETTATTVENDRRVLEAERSDSSS